MEQDNWEKAQESMKKLYIKLMKMIGKMLLNFAVYGFLIFLFMYIYGVYGFERTIVILLVGAVYFGFRKVLE